MLGIDDGKWGHIHILLIFISERRKCGLPNKDAHHQIYVLIWVKITICFRLPQIALKFSVNSKNWWGGLHHSKTNQNLCNNNNFVL